jgi:hypothetical protein
VVQPAQVRSGVRFTLGEFRILEVE